MRDRRRGLQAAARKWGPTTWFLVASALVMFLLAVVTLVPGIHSFFFGATKQNQEAAQADRDDKHAEEMKALKDIYESVGKTDIQPLSENLRNALRKNLADMRSKYPFPDLKVVITIEPGDGNNARWAVAQELSRALEAANITFEDRAAQLLRDDPVQAVEYTIHSEDQSILEAFAKSIDPLLRNRNVPAIRNNNVARHTIRLRLYGTPYFNSDGSVFLK